MIGKSNMEFLRYFTLLLGLVPIISAATIDFSTCSNADTGCLQVPSSCTGSDCDYLVSWMKSSDSVMDIKIQARTSDGWVGLGLSKSGKMPDAAVMVCRKSSSGGNPLVEQYYNQGYTPQILTNPTLGITVIQTSYTDNDGLFCHFQRDISVSGDQKAFPLNAEYTPLLGGGPLSGDSIGIHRQEPPTFDKMDITTYFGQSGAETKQDIKKAHGALMLSAWVLTASLGLLTARYMKSAWPGKQIASKDIWFQVHRACMVLTLLMNSIGFIIIFIDVDGWSRFPEGSHTYQKAHPILGVIISALVIINPIMALFRPGPKDKTRPLFNWFHWGVGAAAFILSMINIYFGLTLPVSPSSTKYVMLAFIIFFVLIEIFLEINKYLSERSRKRSQSMEMQSPHDDTSSQQTAPNLRVRYVLMGLFLLVTLGLWIAMIVLVGK